MINSDILPEDAVNYLNEVESKKAQAEKEIALSAAKTELLSFVNSFIKKSADWRRSSYETKWLRYQRNADGIFDPDISAKKEAWQSRVHVGITASHRETIHSHIYKTMVGVNPPLEIKARYDLGEEDQSKNIRDIILREMDKAKWGIEFDKALHDADTYGSGFIRRSYKTVIEKRKLRKETTETFRDNLDPMGIVGYAVRAATGKLRVSYEDVEEDVIVYRGLSLRHYSIWDIFPDPKALKVKGSAIACRYWATFEDIVRGVKEGYYLSDCVDKLKDEDVTRKYPSGEDVLQSDRGVNDSIVEKTDYQKEHELYELFARMPKKWVYAIMGLGYTNGEELVPARIIFSEKALVAVEINDDYEGEPPIDKLDYLKRNNSFYGVGIPEMLQDSQSVINEVVNQRLDNGALALNRAFAVIEKALVNPKQDLVNRPGQMVRMDAKYVPNGNIANVITPLQITDTPIRAGFSEVNEAERWAQERTSANRVTLGTAGLVKDSNQTLGGQEMLKESAGEKFAYIGLVMELDFLQDFFAGIWKTIYSHIDPDDVEDSIGPERAMSFILTSPEEISRDYVYKPMGVFTMENKAMRQARIMQLRQAFLGAPWCDDEKFFDIAAQNMDEDPERFKKDEQQILNEQAAMIDQSIPPVDTTGQPMPPSSDVIKPIPSQVTAAEAEQRGPRP